MKVAVASDHRGYEGKRRICTVLKAKGHEIVDFGCAANQPCDYPDFAIPAARAVARGDVEAAVLLDSSGIGMSVCANKLHGIRAAVVSDEVMARVARDANHCNVLCVGTDLLTSDHLIEIVETFLATPYSQGRHARRVEKITALEDKLLAEQGVP